jgi:hypothetical protein
MGLLGEQKLHVQPAKAPEMNEEKEIRCAEGHE